MDRDCDRRDDGEGAIPMVRGIKAIPINERQKQQWREEGCFTEIDGSGDAVAQPTEQTLKAGAKVTPTFP